MLKYNLNSFVLDLSSQRNLSLTKSMLLKSLFSSFLINVLFMPCNFSMELWGIKSRIHRIYFKGRYVDHFIIRHIEEDLFNLSGIWSLATLYAYRRLQGLQMFYRRPPEKNVPLHPTSTLYPGFS